MDRETEINAIEKRSFIPPPAQPEATGVQKYRLPGCGLIMLFIAIAWGIEILDFFMRTATLGKSSLDAFGLLPRTFSGLLGVITMPWLHYGFMHLISNTLTFAVLGYLVLATERERFFSTSLKIILISGIGTWLIGRESYHIGASALIYGYFGHLMTRAFLERNARWTVLGIILGVLYGGMMFGLLPKEKVSFEGHLTGFLAGIWLAYNKYKRPAPARISE